MPLYEYECDACGERFEVIQKSFSSPPPEACEKCGKGPVHRMQSSPAIQFKGSGFYITDYAKKPSEAGGSKGKSEGKSEGSKTESSSDSKTSEAKTDSAATKDSTTKSDAPAASTSPASTSTKKD